MLRVGLICLVEGEVVDAKPRDPADEHTDEFAATRQPLMTDRGRGAQTQCCNSEAQQAQRPGRERHTGAPDRDERRCPRDDGEPDGPQNKLSWSVRVNRVFAGHGDEPCQNTRGAGVIPRGGDAAPPDRRECTLWNRLR